MNRRQRLRLDRAAYSAIYAIGDVHGCYRELTEVEAQIRADAALLPGQKLIVFLGDYTDRGPQSERVLDHLCAPPPDGFHRVTLCGNHDDIFLNFLRQPDANMGWLELGGDRTLMSYGVDTDHILRRGGGAGALAAAAREAVPAAHVAFLESLPIMLEIGQLLFVHAGIQPGIALDEQRDEDLLWIREPFLSEGPKLPVIVVHGHTIAPEPFFGHGRIGIDTGAFATGRLTVLKIAGSQAQIL